MVDFFLIIIFLQRVFLGEGFSFFLSFCVGGFSVKKVKKKMEYVTSKGLGVHSAVSSHLLSFNTHNSAMLNTYHHQHNIGLVLTQALDLSSLRSRRKLYKKWGVSKQSRPHVKAAATDELGSAAAAVKEEESQSGEDMFKTLDAAVSAKDAEGVKVALDKLRELGQTKLWSSIPNITRRNTFIRELTTMGIKNAEELAIPSVRNDAAFLGTVVGVTSFVAVVAGQLPGDWGFFVPYLVGSLSLVVLAVGSVAPGLLQVAINSFSGLFSDYQERTLCHEAAHFLTAYLVGVPIVGYSVDLGKEHVNLVDEALQKRIYSAGGLDSALLDQLAVVSMAGLAAEGLKYDKAMGQSADLFSLQRLLNRSKPPLSSQQQQNLTRWAVLYAGSLLKTNTKAYDALQVAMSKGLSVSDCIKAIEQA